MFPHDINLFVRIETQICLEWKKADDLSGD